jgi:hypothetical protein
VNRAIERRLAAVERRLNPPVPTIQEIMILGGLPGSDDPTFATAGQIRWERAPAETLPAFRARAVAAATAAGETYIVIGGLPCAQREHQCAAARRDKTFWAKHEHG